MKKILFVCNGAQFPEGAFRFVNSLRGIETIVLKGVFFTETVIDEAPLFLEPFSKARQEARRETTDTKNSFVEKCKAHGLRYKLNGSESGWDTETFVEETRFADLVVMSKDLFYEDPTKSEPNFFIHEALHRAECPILLVPESFTDVERIIAAYDGKKDSAFAIRQFTQLFPQFDESPTEFVHITDKESNEVPDMSLLKEYSNAHYDAGNIRQLQLKTTDHFSDWLHQKKDALLVVGSFARSAVSRVIKPSFADLLIKKNSLPVFIAHNV